jgi:hypothetical protein
VTSKGQQFFRAWLDRLHAWWFGAPPRIENGDMLVVWGPGPPLVERLRDRMNWIPALRWEWTLPTVLALYGLALGAISVPLPSFTLAVISVWAAAALLVGQSALWLVRHRDGHPLARMAVFLLAIAISVPATSSSLAWVERSRQEFLVRHSPPPPPSSAKPPKLSAATSSPEVTAKNRDDATPPEVQAKPHQSHPSVTAPSIPAAKSEPAPPAAAEPSTDELIANARPYPEPYVPPTTPFSGFSDLSLRNRVASECARLRQFEGTFNSDTKTIASSGVNMSADQFPRIQKQLNDRRASEIAQFQHDFIPEIRALHFELLNRLKLGPPNRYNRTFTAEAAEALNSGILMGQKPASDVCDYLDNLSGRLRK